MQNTSTTGLIRAAKAHISEAAASLTVCVSLARRASVTSFTERGAGGAATVNVSLEKVLFAVCASLSRSWQSARPAVAVPSNAVSMRVAGSTQATPKVGVAAAVHVSFFSVHETIKVRHARAKRRGIGDVTQTG